MTFEQENLYAMRKRAHEAVDALWQQGYMSRQSTYNWLARHMNLKPENCHIALFSLEQCQRAIKAAHTRLRREEMTKDTSEIAKFFDQRLPEIDDQRRTLADWADEMDASPGDLEF